MTLTVLNVLKALRNKACKCECWLAVCFRFNASLSSGH